MNDLLQSMIAKQQLSAADAERVEEITKDGAVVIDHENDVLQWLAEEYDLEYQPLQANSQVDRQLLSQFPARILLKESLLPLSRQNGTVKIATSRLFAVQGMDMLKSLTGLQLQPVIAPLDDIQRELKKQLGVGADTIDSMEEESLQVIDDSQPDVTDLENAAEDASIIRFVNQIFSDAIDLRATDIHIEPFEDELRIRYRVDGVLQDTPVPSQIKRFQPAIVSRIKIISHLNIAEKRLPQDGRIKLKIKAMEVDVRVSIIPMLHGEAVVMRLLRQDSTLLHLSELKMNDRELRSFERVLKLPHGIVLVTGPTGSGKTTTLYTALNEINDSVRKIITIEDPIEYQLKGINQIQVSEKTGLTLSRGLRSILRHDPDVILIGEIRDEETAQIAVQASLTGHLVFSTLHTNDAPGALTRLVDMGVEPYLVASSLEFVIAQRLVRLLCPSCKKVDHSERTATIKQRFGIEQNHPIYEGAGCEACHHTGFYGRRAVFEMMDMNNQVREMILQDASSMDIRKTAVANGMSSLAEDGWRLVYEGVSTVDEILRVSKGDGLDI